ncbi:MAG: helix-turn-helix transcriptional regulator [Clostridiales bacterium]|nr:helix-turn-helix transcriptional regulator [Clostridiales bacterium]
MNNEKIGKFIAECRKEKCFTQFQLAEMLNITDRAVSKWETGRSMPDVSIMLELCKVLNISVNELLNGERLNMNEYNEKAEKLLIEMARKEEKNNKKMMMYEIVIGSISTVSFVMLIMAAALINMEIYFKVALFVIAFVILISGVVFALKIETEAGYYECKNCHHRYVPKFKSVFFAMHIGTTRYLKCPKCHKKTWNKKVMTKE